MKIAPSILSADFGRLAEEIHLLEEAGADWLHLDVMDGHFVPNITIGPHVVGSIRKVTPLTLDVHLMIQEPDRYIGDFVGAGADVLTVHVEACTHLHRTIQHIRSLNARAGVALNPGTPLSALDHVLDDVALVLVMTVNPGFGGQAFIPTMVPKITALHRRVDQSGMEVELEVDGGIKVDNVYQVAEAGATVFVSGSGILDAADYGWIIRQMREKIRNARSLGGRHEKKGRLSLPGG